jgi:tetratricopeptide (TPR) repeat protein
MGEAECYVNLVDASLGKDDVDTAELYAVTGLGTAYVVNVARAIAAAYNSLGLVEMRKGAFGLAMGYFEEAAEIAEDAGAKIQLADAYRYIGEVSLEVENIDGAKGFLQKALELYEQQGNSQNVEKIKSLLQEYEA